jgi:hypothetical protein
VRTADRATIESMPDTPEPRSPTVLATTLPFFARAATIVDETWHDLDRMAGVLAQRLDRLGTESDERVFLELMTNGIREVARRLELTEVALAAYLPTP